MRARAVILPARRGAGPQRGRRGRRYTPGVVRQPVLLRVQMPLREIIGKSIGFGLVSLACIAGGFFAYYGPHSYNDYINIYLPWVLWLIGLGIGGLGALLIAGIVADARERRREEELHVTPRP